MVEAFEQLDIPAEEWDRRAPTVFQTLAWQRCWWAAFGRGQLLIVSDDASGLILPLFLDDGMLYPVGSGNSDYLDALYIDPPSVHDLQRLLRACADHVGVNQITWYLLRDDSPSAKALNRLAEQGGWTVWQEDELPAPFTDIREPGATDKSSRRRAWRWFERNGRFEICHPRGGDLLTALPDFFDQHIDRWSDTEIDSPFLSARERDFYLALARENPAWLRFTQLVWNEQVISQHFGMCFKNRYLWYKPSYETSLASRSPGTALLHQLMLEARDEQCHVFDFGIGDEAFKQRHATSKVMTRTLRIQR